jgi:formylglycine-generating enzyme required for sulfatase activity
LKQCLRNHYFLNHGRSFSAQKLYMMSLLRKGNTMSQSNDLELAAEFAENPEQQPIRPARPHSTASAPNGAPFNHFKKTGVKVAWALAAVLLILILFVWSLWAGKNQTTEQPATKADSIRVMQFASIPPGQFVMGSNKNRDEKPAHTVKITKGFDIQKTEVTQGQWKAVMGSNPSNFSSCGDNCPLENVSWEDVQTFIERLNDKKDGHTYSLPTEAEWEYAARAGTTGDYAGDLDEMAWYIKNSGSKTHPVATKKANAWGLYDMHGNVWEWVSDWYGSDYYQNSPNNDPKGPNSGSARVYRGGS